MDVTDGIACPSDTGSYVCGDLGNDSQCPKKSNTKKTDSDKDKPKTTKKSTKKDVDKIEK